MKVKSKGSGLHPDNIHQGRYDLPALTTTLPDLQRMLLVSAYEQVSIDFANPEAVKLLNKALLLHYYSLSYWDIPKGYLCPPIPGRADYVHHVAELLARYQGGVVPQGPEIRVLDVGTGANLIYPIVATHLFGWSFVATEIEQKALSNAAEIIDANPRLVGKVALRHQPDANAIFKNVLDSGEFFEVSFCNPPFHASPEVALEGSKRKVKNLKGKATAQPVLNFGGQAAELVTAGGELGFIKRMIEESIGVQKQVGWFTVLVSKAMHLPMLQDTLEKIGVTRKKVIQMGQGNKRSRILAWTFLEERERLPTV